MSETAIEILFIILLIAANGLIALSKIAIVSARKAHMQQRADGSDQGAQAAFVGLTRIPALAPYGEAIGLGVVVVSITNLSLVFGELVPKRLAQNNPESIAAGIARPMRAMARLVAPLVNFLNLNIPSLMGGYSSWAVDFVSTSKGGRGGSSSSESKPKCPKKS